MLLVVPSDIVCKGAGRRLNHDPQQGMGELSGQRRDKPLRTLSSPYGEKDIRFVKDEIRVRAPLLRWVLWVCRDEGYHVSGASQNGT